MTLCGFQNTQTAIANGDTRTISLHHIHTSEDLTITYKRNGQYDADALKKIDWFMRDWRKNESTKMDPQAIDILWTVQQQVGNGKPIWIVCGYRSPGTNAMLRARSSGVAEFSQHTQGKAIDFYVPGANLEQTREIGLKLQRGGVGYYPTSGSPFVHMDVGSVRHWPRMSHDQLARVFPDGRTVHIPSDGKPLPNYALALADIESRGTSMPSEISLASARSSGVDTAAAPKNTFLASLFGKKNTAPIDDDSSVEAASSKPSPGARVAAIATDVKVKLDNKKPAAITVASATANTPAPVPGSSEKIAPMKVAAIPMPPMRPARATQVAQNAPITVPRVIADASRATATAVKVLGKAVVASAENVFSARGVWGDDGLKQVDTARPFQVAFAEASGGMSVTSSIPMGYASVIAHAPRPQQNNAAPNSPVEMIRPVQRVASVNFDDVWMRAIVMAPDLQNFMSATIMGATDPKELRPLMRKPKSMLAMTFSSDPTPGMTTSHFSGDAVVFLDSVSFVTRTAMLAQ
jgi:uncharacterized protein YcbK (DUF882 family)